VKNERKERGRRIFNGGLCARRMAKSVKTLFFAAMAAAAILFAPMIAEARELRREHTIEIYVECIDEARAIINELNGYNLESYASLSDGARWATFSRRVDGWAFRHVQAVLREMGEVINESENARFLGADIAAVDTQIAVLSREMERLSTLMAASDTLNVLIAVNDRLNRVARDRDALVGRRNLLISQADSAVINIHLTEAWNFVPPTPMTFGERVSAEFWHSWDTTLYFGENLLVFLAWVSVPFAVWAVGATTTALIVVGVVKNRKGAKKNEAV